MTEEEIKAYVADMSSEKRINDNKQYLAEKAAVAITMTVAQLKRLYKSANPNGHYFDRKTMRFFGDTCRNYGVRKSYMSFTDMSNNTTLHAAWELYRIRPVNGGLKTSAYFDASGHIVG